jgi:hypothetical protein
MARSAVHMKPALHAPYDTLSRDAAAFIPAERLITDPDQ